MKSTLAKPELIVRNGRAVSVILPIKDYEELMERVEDAEDVRWLRKHRCGSLQFRPIEEYLTGKKVSGRVSRPH